MAAEWRKTGAWMESAAAFIGERVWGAEAELREAGGIIVLGLADGGGGPDFAAALARILRARQYVVEAVISRLAFEMDEVRDRVGEQILQERFPENKYGWFHRRLARAATMARSATESDEARDALLAWAELELSALRELREDLRAAEPAILGEKEKRERQRRRDVALVVAGIVIGLLGGLIGLLF